jgi:hypothetical protein
VAKLFKPILVPPAPGLHPMLRVPKLSTSQIKTILGVPYPASVKSILGVPVASVKTVEGLA